VPEYTLSQKRPRPAAKQLKQVQQVFGQTPSLGFGAALVDPMRDDSRQRHTKDNRHRQKRFAKGLYSDQGDNGRNQKKR
jgi:hypothetical protein